MVLSSCGNFAKGKKRDTVMRLQQDQYTVKYNDRKEVRIFLVSLFFFYHKQLEN